MSDVPWNCRVEGFDMSSIRSVRSPEQTEALRSGDGIGDGGHGGGGNALGRHTDRRAEAVIGVLPHIAAAFARFLECRC